MKIIATSSALVNTFADIPEADKELLGEQQKSATELKLKQSVADWWARYFDSEIALSSSSEQIDVRLKNIQTDAENLWERAFNGWQNVFYRSDLPATATIDVNAAKTRMTGSVLPDPTKDQSQLVSFEIQGSGLGLNDETYSVNQFTLKYLVPNTDNVIFTVNFNGNLSFDQGVLNTNSMQIRKLSMSAGGFIDFTISGYGGVSTQPVKALNGSTIRLAVFDFKNANIEFSINNDPARKSDLFKISVGGQFKAYLDDHAQLAAEPLQVLDKIEIQLGDLRLMLTQLNIRSTDSDQSVENSMTQAILRSLKETGIDLGFSADLGNGLRLDVDNARFIQSKDDPYAYSAKGLVMTASVDTRLGSDLLVPMNIQVKFNANFHLKTKEALASLTQFHVFSEASDVVNQSFSMFIDDVLIPTTRLSEIETDSITSLISSISRVNQSKSPTTLSYDGNIDISSLPTVSAVLLTGQAHAEILGNGRDNALTGNAGNNWLDGSSGRDLMMGGLGHDSYVVDSLGERVIERKDAGVDTVRSLVNYTLGPHLENLVLIDQPSRIVASIGRGNSLDNRIEGNAGQNFIMGADGHDVLDGKLGNDRLSGGPGNDRFVFSTAPDATQNFDTITDFVRGQDKLVLSSAVFSKWTSGQLMVIPSQTYAQSSLGANDYLIFNPYTQQLLYDADGNGAAPGSLAPVPVVFLSGVTNLNASDIISDLGQTFTLK